MKKSFILIFTVLSSLGLFAQTKTANNIQCDSIISYKNVDKLPEFKTEKFYSATNYMYNNINYPEDVNVIGPVGVSFVVTKDGEIRDIKIVKELCSLCDQEVVRVLSSMPDWNPGIKDGKKVNTLMYLEIDFTIYPSSKY